MVGSLGLPIFFGLKPVVDELLDLGVVELSNGDIAEAAKVVTIRGSTTRRNVAILVVPIHKILNRFHCWV